MLISICVCTYQREHVVTTLVSIGELKLPTGVSAEVIVVDNDEAGSARNLVETQAQNMTIPLFYYRAQGNNIATARNKSMSEAKGEWLAFIDDDEIADKDWLINLWSTAQQYDADAVFGRVKSIYPSKTPNWIINSRVFDRGKVTNGEQVTSGATNSTLVRHKALTDNHLKFDISYGLTGGEDADLFYRLHKHGAKLVCSTDAFVSEEIEHSRLNLTYLVKKSIRIGETYTRYRLQQASRLRKSFFLLNVLAKLVLLLLIVLIKLPFGQQYYAKSLLQLLDKYGKLKALFSNKRVQLYG